MKWLQLAFQNVLRNRRRSLMTMSIAAVGTAAILLSGGFALSTYEALSQGAARTTGHLIVGTPRFFSSEEEVPLQHGIDGAEKIAAEILKDDDVRAVLPQISFTGLVSNGEKSTAVLGLAVSPTSEFIIKGPFLRIIEGDVLKPEPEAPEIMLGVGLAKSLNASVGSSLTVLATTTEGAMNAVDVVVGGIFSVGVPDVDKRSAFVAIPTAQQLIGSTRVSSMGVFLRNMEVTDATRGRIAQQFPELQIRTWEEEAVFYRAVKSLYDRIFGALGLILGFIIVVVVTNAMAISVIERTREIGTLRALGTFPRQLVTTFSLEGALLGGSASVLGALVAGITAIALYIFPVQMPPPPGRSTSYPLHITVDIAMYAGTIIAMVLLCIAASAWVSRRTVNKSIVDALSHA